MARAFLLFAGGLFLLGACSQRTICPAFQSAYIYDKDELRKKFSYFQEDSTPKILTASKNRYLVAEPTPYRKKVRSLQTVEMKRVFVVVPDSLSGKKDSVSMSDLDRAARSVIDSTFIVDVPATQSEAASQDSVYVITKDRELRLLKYNGADSLVYDPSLNRYVSQKPQYYVKDVRLNIEQDNYMWYLRDYLVLPDVKLARLQQQNAEKSQKASGKKEKQGFRGFFKNLFKKKQKSDTTDLPPPPPRDEFEFIDTEADSIAQAPRPTEPDVKKGFFPARKKKGKGNKSESPDEMPEAPGKRDDDPLPAEQPEEGF